MNRDSLAIQLNCWLGVPGVLVVVQEVAAAGISDAFLSLMLYTIRNHTTLDTWLKLFDEQHATKGTFKDQ